ncbi:hypothetical protein ACKKBF_B01280 [Auxenochlorella protothecoides x Auxenochlorella symbiontica]|uniref:Mitochondrial thiamine pyrophosphate carrier n=1 Tax=Auxenochlorella protothecoides TaxID=3075 RepID=A0A1D2A2R3_AUXPR
MGVNTPVSSPARAEPSQSDPRTASKPGDRRKASSENQYASSVASTVAGALAGAVSRFATGPLDVLKIRFQVQLEPVWHAAAQSGRPLVRSKYTSIRQALATIIKEEGIQGLWRGTVPGQLLSVPYTAAQFFTVQQSRQLAKRWGVDTHPAASFLTGALSGAAGTVASYPFDLLRTTLAAQGVPRVYNSMADAAKGIVANNGPAGLYRGMGITILEIIPYAALQFGLYDYFNKCWEAHRARYPSLPGSKDVQHLVCGLASGLLAKLATHPLDVAKKRVQVAGLARSTAYGERVALVATRSLRGCLADIYRREGFAGLYKGVAPSVLKAGPSAAITFAAYELFLRWLSVAQEARRSEAASGE